MRPVLRGMVQYIELLDTRLTLEDFARMNDAIDVEEENRARIVEALGAKNGR